MAEVFAPQWWVAWKARAALTSRSPRFLAWLHCQRIQTPLDLERCLSPVARGGVLDFRYSGGLASWEAARARGWAACAEVGAFASAASGALWPSAPVVVLLEGDGGNDESSYQHLRIAIGGAIVDPYEREARKGEGQRIDWLASPAESWFRRAPASMSLESFR